MVLCERQSSADNAQVLVLGYSTVSTTLEGPRDMKSRIQFRPTCSLTAPVSSTSVIYSGVVPALSSFS